MNSKKPSNPKDALGIKKGPLSVIPLRVLFEVGLGMLEGALKYGRHNYRVIGVRSSVYMDATMRHLSAWWEGQDIDPDSKLSHITKAISSLVVLRDAMIQGNLNDDRPPRDVNSDWMTEINEMAAKLMEKYPEPVPPYTHQTSDDTAEYVSHKQRNKEEGKPQEGKDLVSSLSV